MTSNRLAEIRARVEAYEAAMAAHESLEPGEWNTTVRADIVRAESTLHANALDDLRALLKLAEASKRFKEVFGESRIDDWSDDFDTAMDAWMAAVDELTEGGT